jgi:rhodanese-related sulfurtransferase
MIPEITVTDLAARLKTDDPFILLDVREPFELSYAKLDDKRLEIAPISSLSQQGLNALSDKARAQEAEILVLCHHGSRSAQVTAWLLQQGWKNVKSVQGGIDEYARRVDASVGLY